MEDSSKKIFTNKAISLATFFGGPLAAGFLIAKNFKAFGNNNAANNSIFLGILSTLFLFALLFLLPENISDKIPNALLPAIYTLIIYFIVERFQGSLIKQHIDNNGALASNWIAALYGFYGMLLIAVVLISMIYFVQSNGYNKNVKITNNVVLYYNNTIDKDKVDLVSQAIKHSEFMNENNGADIFIKDSGKALHLIFVVPDKSLWTDTLIANDFNFLENYLNYNLGFDKRVEILFTDAELKKEFLLPEQNQYGQKYYQPISYLKFLKINEYQTLYYNCFVSQTDLQFVVKTVETMKNFFPEKHAVDIIFLNYGDDFIIKFFVSKDLWTNEIVQKQLKISINYMKYLGVKQHVTIVLIDNDTLEEYRI